MTISISSGALWNFKENIWKTESLKEEKEKRKQKEEVIEQLNSYKRAPALKNGN